MKKTFLLLALLFCASGAFAQNNYNVNIGGIQFASGSVVPGSCPKDGGFFWKNVTTENWYMCIAGSYVAIGSGVGTVTGSSLTSGNVITGAGSSAIQDGGTLLSALARLASPTFTGIVNVPNGTACTAGNQGIQFATAGEGFWYDSANGALALCLGGAKPFGVTSGGAQIISTGVLGFSSGAVGGAYDAAFSRDAAGVVDVGTGAAASKAGLLRSGNTVRVASNFTTAAVTTLQTITGLSWTFPATGTMVFSFHCHGSYSIATAAVAVAFGIQAATAAPTNITATGEMYTAAGTPTTGTLATLASTTATNIVSGTPAATATNNVFDLYGTIENPATTANTINIMVSTATAADVVTVNRGAYCSLQ